MDLMTKTQMTFGLMILALFEFATAMYIYGIKGKKWKPKLVLAAHRIGGYVFLLWFLWPMIVGLQLLARLNPGLAAEPLASGTHRDPATGWQMDARVFTHAFLAVAVFVLLLVKVLYVRVFQQFRIQARWIGTFAATGTVVVWVIAGWFWLAMLSGSYAPGPWQTPPPAAAPAEGAAP